MSQRPILQSIDYAISRDGQSVQLTVEAEYLTFVEETIPDGQMAGMKGHRPVRSTNQVIYDLHPEQARMMRDQLDAALFGLE